MQQDVYVLGIDSGTQSLRAGIFDLKGAPITYAVKEYPTFYPQIGWAEQSAIDWWNSVKITVNQCIQQSGINVENIIGISVDGTSCTVLPVDRMGIPLRNALLWMDIRAHKESELVNASKHPILKYVGGQESPEWMIPKALWLKRNEPDTYKSAYRIIESTDWLMYKLTGRWTASKCNITCKWNYAAPEGGWADDFLKEIGLEDIREKWPDAILNMGDYAGEINASTALELGLKKGTIVAQGGIDAYAGMLGLATIKSGRLALVIGTSTCHMVFSDKPVWNSGVWGPYPDAIIQDSWILEGGQTATGSIIQWFIKNFVSEEKLTNKAINADIYELLDQKAADVGIGSEGLVLLDYWQGNRTPIRDPLLRGAIWGLSLKHSVGHVFRSIYEGTAFGTRDIIENLGQHGLQTQQIYACGGGTKSNLWLQIHADICNMPIYLTQVPEAVTLGTAICAAVGAGKYTNLVEASEAMVQISKKIEPNRDNREAYDFYFDKYKRTYFSLKDLMHEVTQKVEAV